MGQYNKGIETKSSILLAARGLFYEKGYRETSVREIVQLTDANLGLIKYHFGSKSHIALSLYRELRGEMNRMVEQNCGEDSGVFFSLTCNLCELKLAMCSRAFGRFFCEIMREKLVQEFYQDRIIIALRKYMKQPVDESYFVMTCLSISAIKPALINWVLESDEPVDQDVVLRYYLEQYIHFLGETPELQQRVLGELQRYYFNMVDNFTLVMVPLVPGHG